MAFLRRNTRDEPVQFPERVLLVGVNHKTLGVAEREHLTKLASNSKELLTSLAGKLGTKELAIISTCNRFEVLGVGIPSEDTLKDFILSSLPKGVSSSAPYVLKDRDAVLHLFRVTSSLDSLAVGEAQILGQVKDSYRDAIALGLAGKYLHSLFQFSFRLAKKVRGETTIAERGVSVSYIAVQLASRIFGDLADLSVLVIGSGKMAELTVLHLQSHRCKDIIVANRTLERATELASKVEGSAIGLSEIPRALDKVDMVIGSIQTDTSIIGVEEVRQRKRARPLFLIDLGVPRNFSPALDGLDDVYLYNIDDLSTIANENKSLREAAAKDAEVILEYGLHQFERWLKKLAMEPGIVSLRGRVRAICSEEIQTALKGQVSDAVMNEMVEKLTHRIGQKVSHEVQSMVGDFPQSNEEGESEFEKVLPYIFDEILKID